MRNNAKIWHIGLPQKGSPFLLYNFDVNSLKKNIEWYSLALLFASVLFIWYGVFAENQAGKLTVSFLDVGQGDAIFIEGPNGNQVLVDGGPNKAILRELGHSMPFYDHSIDVVMETHPDLDHIGGLPDVLNNYKVETIIEDGLRSETAAEKELENIVAEKKVNEIIAVRGMKIDLGGGAFLEILSPDRDVSGSDTNTASIVAKLVYGKTSFLLTGDAPTAIENYLAKIDGKNLKTDVLKVAHHGSKNSASESFLGFASPEVAVISAGLNNRYGHPNQEILDMFNRFGIPFAETFKDGDIVFESDGERVERVK
ncbi:MAG: MBL fold metallo-hydrolase [Candidatus Paceibacterota bacterium]